MPTPESESFLRQKPKVPPTFQGVDFQDNEAVADARDAIIREQWVQRMMRRLVGEEMGMFTQQWRSHGCFLKKTERAGDLEGAGNRADPSFPQVLRRPCSDQCSDPGVG